MESHMSVNVHFWRAGVRARICKYFCWILYCSKMIWMFIWRKSMFFSKRYLQVYFGDFHQNLIFFCRKKVFDMRNKFSNWWRLQSKLVNIFSQNAWIAFRTTSKASLDTIALVKIIMVERASSLAPKKRCVHFFNESLRQDFVDQKLTLI